MAGGGPYGRGSAPAVGRERGRGRVACGRAGPGRRRHASGADRRRRGRLGLVRRCDSAARRRVRPRRGARAASPLGRGGRRPDGPAHGAAARIRAHPGRGHAAHDRELLSETLAAGQRRLPALPALPALQDIATLPGDGAARDADDSALEAALHDVARSRHSGRPAPAADRVFAGAFGDLGAVRPLATAAAATAPAPTAWTPPLPPADARRRAPHPAAREAAAQLPQAHDALFAQPQDLQDYLTPPNPNDQE